ncbi:uncharacterized protein BXZ73DRAFT_85367 [Epithele typhae]|uniref:uncharacterized protein n=1 Tax=Epithele typhae TaxID=378194 RepID=UPI002007A95B|nr:uncharacterized protein BXZ73DRAFT_85367 [Epithele typhae]KAH9904615.1 hypothetical protein BXZ73DRAFT_85367 [Epithele typhae]
MTSSSVSSAPKWLHELAEPPVSTEELPPWVFYVDHYSAHTSVPLPKAQDFRALPSTFRSVIHPSDHRTRLPLWLVDLWRQLRDIDTHRRNIVSGLHWLHRFQEQNDLDYNIFGEAIWPIFLRPALLHPWCDIFTSLITDHRDINDEVMDAATAVAKFKADALGGTQHYYSSLISQLQPVDLVDLFSKRAAQGDFTVDSIIYIPWILGDHWIFAIINIPGRDICIGDTTHQSDHDGQLEVAKRTMSRIAHAVEASVSQTRTDWYVQEYKFRCGIQDTPFPSGVAIAVTLVGAVVDEAKPMSSEHEDSHRIAVFFEILENLPTKHVDPNSYQKSVWELEDDRDVSSLPPSTGVAPPRLPVLTEPLTVPSTCPASPPSRSASPPAFTRQLARPRTLDSHPTAVNAATPPPAFVRAVARPVSPSSSSPPAFARRLSTWSSSPPAFTRQLAHPPTPDSRLTAVNAPPTRSPSPPVFTCQLARPPTPECRQSVLNGKTSPPAFVRAVARPSSPPSSTPAFTRGLALPSSSSTNPQTWKCQLREESTVMRASERARASTRSLARAALAKAKGVEVVGESVGESVGVGVGEVEVEGEGEGEGETR